MLCISCIFYSKKADRHFKGTFSKKKVYVASLTLYVRRLIMSLFVATKVVKMAKLTLFSPIGSFFFHLKCNRTQGTCLLENF